MMVQSKMMVQLQIFAVFLPTLQAVDRSYLKRSASFLGVVEAKQVLATSDRSRRWCLRRYHAKGSPQGFRIQKYYSTSNSGWLIELSKFDWQQKCSKRKESRVRRNCRPKRSILCRDGEMIESFRRVVLPIVPHLSTAF